MSSWAEKLESIATENQRSISEHSARCYLKKHLSNHFGKVIEEEEYVRVFKPIDNKVEIWKKIRKDKGDWLLEFTGSTYPLEAEHEQADERRSKQGN